MLDTNKGFSIDGRAGTGKSFLIKELHEEMRQRGLMYISLAPTNKAARVISGYTVHKLITAFNIKRFKDKRYRYVFVGEISMVLSLIHI